MMRTSPLRGWHDCFLSSDPRVETRGYSPVPLRGSPLPHGVPATMARHGQFQPTRVMPSDAVSHGVAQSCSRGF